MLALVVEDVVAILLGRPIPRSRLEDAPLEQRLLPPLYEKYRRDKRIEATEEEIREAAARSPRS